MLHILRRLMPKDRSDLVGVVATGFLLVLIVGHDLVALSQQQQQLHEIGQLVKLLVGLFILFNVVGNQLKAMLTDTTIHAIDLPSVLLAEWRYCPVCELNAPPRSHHCYSCRKCVLKRHSHCLFLGKCAGHLNHRYYLLFVVYVWLGTLYSLWLNQDYFIDLLGDLTFRKFFVAFVPLLALIVRMISLGEFVRVLCNSLCLLLSLMLLVYGLINLRMAARGQTWRESTRGITKYRLGSAAKNLFEVFGRNWRSALVCPLARLELPSDGARFRSNDDEAETWTSKPGSSGHSSFANSQHVNKRAFAALADQIKDI